MLYAIPDTTVEILQSCVISDNQTLDIRSAYTQYFNDQFEDDAFDDDADPVKIPVMYSTWDDSIQLYPIPINTDSIYFKCFVEHPAVSAVGDSIHLKVDYKEAAFSYAMYLTYRRFQEYEVAQFYLADYDRRKKALQEKRTPKFERLKAE